MNSRPGTADPLLAILSPGATLPPPEWQEQQWHALIDAAARHGVLPLLYCRLQKRDGLSRAPAAARRRLDEGYTLDTLRAESRRRHLTELLAALQARDVPVVLLKGAYLAAHVYPSLATRPLGDFDLLVPEEQLGAAMAAGVDAGYTPPGPEEWAAFEGHRHPPPLHRPGRLPVELHVTIEPCAPPFILPLGDVWARAIPAPAVGPEVLALAPEDLLLHLATHMGWSHLLGTSLLRIHDVAAWIGCFGETADWDAIISRTVSSGTRRFVYAALALAERLLAAEIPADVRRTLRHDGDAEVIADAVALLDANLVELSGAIALTLPGYSAWAQLRRVGRALVVPPARQRGSSGAPAADWDRRTHRDSYRARWKAVARFLLNPLAARAALQRVGQVKRLRTWASGSG